MLYDLDKYVKYYCTRTFPDVSPSYYPQYDHDQHESNPTACCLTRIAILRSKVVRGRDRRRGFHLERASRWDQGVYGGGAANQYLLHYFCGRGTVWVTADVERRDQNYDLQTASRRAG